MDSVAQASVPDAKAQALTALNKYIELENQVKDSTKRFLLLTLENRKPITDLYSLIQNRRLLITTPEISMMH
jgi:hypothetical protein